MFGTLLIFAPRTQCSLHELCHIVALYLQPTHTLQRFPHKIIHVDTFKKFIRSLSVTNLSPVSRVVVPTNDAVQTMSSAFQETETNKELQFNNVTAASFRCPIHNYANAWSIKLTASGLATSSKKKKVHYHVTVVYCSFHALIFRVLVWTELVLLNIWFDI